MKRNLVSLKSLITNAIGNELFFKLTLVWFFFNSAWIAISGLYPMAFDERFHLEVIKIYSDRVHPFWSSMPAGDAPYGALSRDPSYLYHFLMAVPYRFLELFTLSERSEVTILRFVSIALFIAGLAVFRKVILIAGVSKKLSNVIIAFVAATPVVSLLAAQVNYDNLLFLIVGLALLQTQKIIKEIDQNKFSFKTPLLLGIICMIGALVKYAFLPILVGIGIILLYELLLDGRKNSWKQLKNAPKKILADYKTQPLKLKLVILVPFIILFGLCLERYAVNLYRYKSPAPECDKILTVSQCYANPPWRRNYITRWAKENGKLDEIKDTNFIKFALKGWPEKMTYHLFYTIGGEKIEYLILSPVMITRNISLIIMAIGLLHYLINLKKIRKKYSLNPLLFITIFYILSLLLQNYSDFVYLGYPFGIQGRYLIQVLPVLYAAIAIGFNSLKILKPKYKSILAISGIVFILTQGGGASTFIIRSNEQWYWPDKKIVYINHRARTILSPFIIGD